MCGIAGYHSTDAEFPPDLLSRMCDSIVHRGPDDSGAYFDGPVGLGMRRLSIIDLESGQQPISNEDGSIVMVCNGEIYNYVELRAELIRSGHQFRSQSDVEVIVHLYEEYGVDFVSRLEGMFAFALWDGNKRRLILGRDRFGMKPLFLAQTDRGGFIYCSELKGILCFNQIDRAIDHCALDLFLTYQYVPAPRTIYKGVQKLPPAHYAIITPDGCMRTHQYWHLDNATESEKSSNEVDEVEALLVKSVKSHLVSDVPLGAFLSGGVDSGLVAAIMAKESSRPVQTFTIRFPGEKGGIRDESGEAKKIAKHIGAKHTIFDVDPQFGEIVDELVEATEEPFADDSIVPSYYVCRETSHHVKVALSGLGGDELFGGYMRHRGNLLAQRYAQVVPKVCDRLVLAILNLSRETASSGRKLEQAKRFIRGVRLPECERYADMLSTLPPQSRRLLYAGDYDYEKVFKETVDYICSRYDRAPKSDPVSRALYTDTYSYLSEDVLALTDRMSMQHSLEVRVPFLDREMVEKVWSLPSSLKIHRGQQKYLLREIASKWLPASILEQPKQGFEAPMSAWLRGPLSGYMQDVLSPARVKRSGLFNPVQVTRLMNEHVQGKQRHNKVLFSLIMVHLWMDRQTNSCCTA